MTDNAGNDNAGKDDTADDNQQPIKDIRISDEQIEFIKKQIAETKLKEKLDQQSPTKEQLAKLQAENDQLRATQRKALLKEFDEKEQEEYKDYSNDQLELVLQIKKKYATPKGIRRQTDQTDSTTTQETIVKAGSIGEYKLNKKTGKFEFM